MRDYACAILLRDGLILLGKRSPHRKAYPNCWDVIGGRVEQGETIDAALHRELGEEIGIAPSPTSSYAASWITARRSGVRRSTTCTSSAVGPAPAR